MGGAAHRAALRGQAAAASDQERAAARGRARPGRRINIIRTLGRDELGFCLDLAAAEGWNPGLYDANAFWAADPGGFFVAEVEGEKIGCISAVRYDAFGFIGLFIVRPHWRKKGYGRALWERAMRHLSDMPAGLDGVAAQQENYKRSGFEYAYANIRYQCDVREPRDRFASGLELAPLRVADDELFAYDRACFGADRSAFIQPWIVQPDVVALTARSLLSSELVGYGVGRACREGTKIGPLFASRLDIAAVLFDAIAGRTRSPWFLDVPAPNAAAVGFADERGMKPVFETARMWRGPAPSIDLEKVYGLTSLELG